MEYTKEFVEECKRQQAKREEREKQKRQWAEDNARIRAERLAKIESERKAQAEARKKADEENLKAEYKARWLAGNPGCEADFERLWPSLRDKALIERAERHAEELRRDLLEQHKGLL